MSTSGKKIKTGDGTNHIILQRNLDTTDERTSSIPIVYKPKGWNLDTIEEGLPWALKNLGTLIVKKTGL